MGKQTAIVWCDHTFNPWWGCQKVSPGCANCYAEAFAKRTGHDVWGGSHRFFGDAHWREPLEWEREAAGLGERRRVFCASMADVFEVEPQLVAPRRRLLDLIGATQALDWLLLTKRPENVKGMLREVGLELPPNVWLGASVEDQERADERIPKLLKIPARIRFLSCEPLLGPVDLRSFGSIDWVIIGGESGPKARVCEVGWIRSLVRQCLETGVAPFVKQLGARPFESGFGLLDDEDPDALDVCPIRLRDKKGADPFEWPEDLRIQSFPERLETEAKES